jgi:hypothetical protein
MKGRDYSKDLCIDGKIILDCILNKVEGGDWIHLTQNRDQW